MTRRGFTLIELLVVIAIIGLLSSIALASLESARTKARDARRLSDFEQYRIAIQLYFDDNDQWPCTSLVGAASYIDSQSHCLGTALAPYLSSIPLDPQYGGDGNTVWGQDYQYNANSSQFYLRTAFETDFRPTTHAYPSGSPTACTTSGNGNCPWYGTECVYQTGSCSLTWLHMGGE